MNMEMTVKRSTKMKKKTQLYAVITSMFLFLMSSAVYAMEVMEIVQKANHMAYYQGQDGKATVSMKIVDGQNRERIRDFTILRRDMQEADTEQRFYVFFKRPADINKTAFLVWKHVNSDDDRWMYLPALDLVKRIAASDERSSFVGSHFFYEDVSGRSVEEDNHQLIEETEHYFVIKSEPKKPDTVEFAYYKNWIFKQSFLPVKTEYFDRSESNYRTYEVLNVENIDNHQTVTRAKMSDSRIGGYSELEYSRVVYDQGFEEDLFTERYLRNPPKKALR